MYKDRFVRLVDRQGNTVYLDYNAVRFIFYDKDAKVITVDYSITDQFSSIEMTPDEFFDAVERHIQAIKFRKKLSRETK